MYPEDSIQWLVGESDWWVPDADHKIRRGSLIFAFVPHVDQLPYTVEPVGRRQPDQHTAAEVKIAPLRTRKARKTSNLPVAAMPLHAGEVWAAYRAKKRPCLVVGCGSSDVDRKLVRGSPKRATAPTVLVVPCYGVDQGSKRAGYNPVFVERVRHCEYPQFFWDRLPVSGPEESILRFDHLQPIGTHYNSYEFSGYALGSDALDVVDEYVRWLFWCMVSPESLLALFREEIDSSLGS